MNLAIIIVVCVALVAFGATAVARRKSRRRTDEESAYNLGLNAMISGDRDAAVLHLKTAVRQDPRNLDAYIKLGNLLRERGRTKQAIQVHRELLVKRRLPRTVRSSIIKCLALDLAEAERWAEVIESIGSLPRGERVDPRMTALLRDACEETGQMDRAVQTHKDVLKSAGADGQPSLAVYRAHVATRALAAGDRAKAKTGFLGALKEDSVRAALANLYLGDMAASEEDTERAIAYWTKLLADAPGKGHLAFERLEKAYFEIGDYGRMMRVYEDVLLKTPSNVPALCGLSRMHERKGDVEEAVRVAREAIKHEGDTALGHRRLIQTLVAAGRLDEAARIADGFLARTTDEAAFDKCPHCGDALGPTGWRCPSCHKWIDVD
jgi:lipopolysaccharide biosynthesis regulator YciM